MEPLNIVQNVLKLEAQAIEKAISKLKSEEVEKFLNLIEELVANKRSLVFCGVGKSGIIAQKLSSTFCSLGLPSFFLHPVDALHGDLGRVGAQDGIVLISKSGSTEELMKVIPFLPMEKNKMVGLLGKKDSVLWKKCGFSFDCSVEKEACLNNQAPTTSSTLALAMGDALAVLYESHIGLSKENFAINHPGGMLGKSLRMKVSDLIIPWEGCPIADSNGTLEEVILKMTKIPVGGLAVCDSKRRLQGIVVEGDIRRVFTKENEGLNTSLERIMNKDPYYLGPDELAFKALEIMERKEINILPILNEEKIFQGFLRIYDLFKEGFSLSNLKSSESYFSYNDKHGPNPN